MGVDEESCEGEELSLGGCWRIATKRLRRPMVDVIFESRGSTGVTVHTQQHKVRKQLF